MPRRAAAASPLTTVTGVALSGTVVDAVSGVSGAGRKAEVKSLFCEVSMQAYGVFKHRHRPEIAEHAGVPTIFTPHLGCYDRGILATVHLELVPGLSSRCTVARMPRS